MLMNVCFFVTTHMHFSCIHVDIFTYIDDSIIIYRMYNYAQQHIFTHTLIDAQAR